ncbi:MAG: hypothetical protein H6730_00090 [Deltaproteobacteria bacterium]|nr:hypothetical protein [Deltaproteobacteria bacterium]
MPVSFDAYHRAHLAPSEAGRLTDEIDPVVPDSCWIAGAVASIAARTPRRVPEMIRTLEDGRLALRYYRLEPSADGTLAYDERLHPTNWREQDLAKHGWYRFVERSVIDMMPHRGGQPSDVHNLLLGRKHRMVPLVSRGAIERLQAALSAPQVEALPVLATRPQVQPPFVPEHAYLVVAEARIDGQPAFRLRDAVTREELVATHEELLANGASVSLSDR